MSGEPSLLSMLSIIGCQILILFFSIVAHEVGHGYMAYKLGDPTAKRMGRLTINPAKHFDLVGFLVFLFTLGLVMIDILPIPIGWAKPVLIDFRYFKNPRKCMALVAVMGPLMNIALAALFMMIFLILAKISFIVPGEIAILVIYAIFINLLLAGLNLLPIPPLDGSNILAGFLPWRFTMYFHKMRFLGIAMIFLIIVRLGDEKLNWLVKKFYESFDIYFIS